MFWCSVYNVLSTVWSCTVSDCGVAARVRPIYLASPTGGSSPNTTLQCMHCIHTAQHTAQHYTILHSTAQNCTTPTHTESTVQHCSTLWPTVLQCIHWITKPNTTQHYTTKYSTTLHNSLQHNTSLNCPILYMLHKIKHPHTKLHCPAVPSLLVCW